MKKEPISLNELPYDGEFLNALSELENRIIEDFQEFSPIRPARLKEFIASLGYLPGRKYLKIVKESAVWGFINLTNKNFKEGDILKAAGWASPALNKARGNIFHDNYEISWTGPKYLPGSTGLPSYEMKKGTA